MIALGGILASGFAWPSSTLASCNPGRANQDFGGFAGTLGSPAGLTGIRSNLLEYDPWVTPGSEVSAWVMLYNGGTKWAQVGWYEDTARRVFVQYTNNTGVVFTQFLAVRPLAARTRTE